jgi:hypothetical protein
MKYLFGITREASMHFARERGWKPAEYVIVSEVEQLRGLRGVTLYLIGNYTSNRNWKEVEHIAMPLNINLVEIYGW